MPKNNFNGILAEKKTFGTHFVPNHYEVIGIENFSAYDEKIKNIMIAEARKEIKDEADQRDIKELIQKAHSILKDPALKTKYDETLKIYLEQKKSSGDQKVGLPSLQVENEEKLIFNEVKLDSVVTQTIIITNKSGGILNGTITIPKGQNWLDVNPKNIKQSELPLKVNVTVNPRLGNFSLSDLRSEVLIFSYRTDNGIKEEKKRIEVRTEGLDKKIQRLSIYSIWIFVGLYTLLVGIQTFNNVGNSIFSTHVTFLYRMLTWTSIPLLYMFLRDYNIYGFERLKRVFGRETFREKLELFSLILLLFFSFELFILFAIGVGVLWLNKQVLITLKIINGTFYTPFIGILFYGLILTQLPNSLQKFTTRQQETPPAATSPVSGEMYVQILKDCIVRTSPSLQGKVVFIAKKGETYKLASNQAINNEWGQIFFSQNSVERKGYLQVSQENVNVFSQ